MPSISRRRLQHVTHISARPQLPSLKRTIHQLAMFHLASLQMTIGHFTELDRTTTEDGGVGDVALRGGAADDVGAGHGRGFDGGALDVRGGD